MKLTLRLLIALLLAAAAGSVGTVHARLTEQLEAGTTAVEQPAYASQPRRVLVLYWYNIENPATVAFDHQVQAVLRRQGAGEFIYHAEYLEAGRFPGEEQQLILRDYLRRKYRDRKIDVLLTWGAPPLAFVLTYRKDLFPDTPIVFYSSEIDSVKDLVAEPLTGVLNPAFYETTMELALRLHPDAREAFVITGTANHDKVIEREISQQFEQFKSRVKFTYLTDLPYDELLATVKSLPRRSIIFYGRAAVGDAGALAPGEVLDAISRAAPAPVYCAWRSLLGNGSVGGIVDDPVAGATKATEIAIRVARGARPQDIPTDRTPRIPTFDWRQLSRWGISEDRLPSGSVILFREATLWGQYRGYIIAAGVVLAVQTLLIAGLLVQRSRRRHVEGALQENQKRYALATDAGAVGVWDWNLETNDIWIDPALKSRLGFDDHEIANHLDSWVARVHPDDAARVLDDARAHAAGNATFYETEHRKVDQNGNIRWFLTRGSAVRLEDGRAVRIIGTDTDITELKIAEARAEEMRHELTRVSRVTMLAQFAASIAHEVSQPLNAVFLNAKACLRWIENSAPSTEELRPALRDITEAARRATEVVSRNRELFKHHEVEKRLLDVNSVVRDVAVLARTRLQQGRVALDTALEGDLPNVFGDRVELQQVLLNLVLNGIEAMSKVDGRPRRLRIETRLLEFNLVRVTVRDTGVGLGGVDVERMFTPLYTTKPSGTGVGLSISRLIVEAHGGTLRTEPHDGPGTTFYFTIPAAPGEALERGVEPESAGESADLGMPSQPSHTNRRGAAPRVS